MTLNTKAVVAVLVVAVIVVAGIGYYALSNGGGGGDDPSTGDGVTDCHLWVYGNVNGDDYIDQNDIDLLERIIAGEAEEVLIVAYDGYSATGVSQKISLADANMDGVLDEKDVQYIRDTIVPEFFKHMWIRRTVGKRETQRILEETTNEIAQRVGAEEVIRRLVPLMKDKEEVFRSTVLNAIKNVISLMGVSDLDLKLEEQMMNGLLFAFQEQGGESTAAVVNPSSFAAFCRPTRFVPFRSVPIISRSRVMVISFL